LKTVIRSFVVLTALCSAFAFAGPDKTPHCPKCKMELSAKKDKMHSVAVKIGKKTWFCCAACGAHKKK
jgi:hypothetical protein